MENTLDLELARRFIMALGIGALVGVEREKRRENPTDSRAPVVAGLRTFTLLGLAGATAAWLGRMSDQDLLFLLGAAGVVLLLVIGPRERSAETAPGLTTKTAAIVVYLLGGACMYGQAETAVALGIVTSGTLALKQPLHDLVKRIGPDDLVAGLKLLFASFIVLPMLPSVALDPWGVLVPSRLWLLVVLISALSLAGYVAVRALGERKGTALTGVFGGMVSSTAVTLSFSRASKVGGAVPLALGAGVLFAWAVMFVRVLVEVAVVHAPLLPRLLLPLGAMAVVSALAGGWCYWRTPVGSVSNAGDEVTLKNPFSLTAAVRFAAFFAVILLTVELVREYAPGGGVYAVAALAGTTDVDAITLSMAGTVRDGGDATEAVMAIGVAALTNTLVKTGMAMGLGSPELRRVVGIAAAVVAVAGVVGLGVSAL